MEFKLELVPIPVADVDRAKHFYADLAGFAVDLDHQISDTLRIVQLTPEGSGCSIMLGSGTDKPPGSVQGIQLVVADIDAARARLADAGVDITPVRHFEDGGWVDGHGGPWNNFAHFSDPDGNGWVLQERP